MSPSGYAIGPLDHKPAMDTHRDRQRERERERGGEGGREGERERERERGGKLQTHQRAVFSNVDRMCILAIRQTQIVRYLCFLMWISFL